MSGWFRRNRLALVAVVVLVPASIAVTFSNEWNAYFSGRPSQPVVVAADQGADFGGAGWRVVSTKRIAATSQEGQDAALPVGSDLLVVTTEVTPGALDADGKSPGCELRLEELSGTDVLRSWGDAAFDPIDYRVSAGAASFCDTERTSAYSVETVFVVPSSAGTAQGVALALQVSVADQLPMYLRMTL